MPLRHHSHLRGRFIALGLSKSLAGALAATVSHWVEGSGQEWTVNRLKQIKTAFLRRIAGESYSLPHVATRVDTLGPIPRGAFGQLWDSVGTDITSISRALNAMMVYSTFVAPVVTDTQWKKFHSSMTRNPVEGPLMDLRIPSWMKVNKEARLTSFEELVITRKYSYRKVNEDLTAFVESDTGMALWSEFPQYKSSFQSEIADAIDKRIGMDDYFGYHPSLNLDSVRSPVGILGCTQEPGYKLRVFASPNIVHQCAMSRLKRQLFTLLHSVRWDCTYDQSSGTDWARRQLDQGREMFSIDLSDATNNFPLELQLNVLRGIGCAREDVELFHRLSRLPWLATHDSSGTHRWTVGQPLGLGPSFAAFALTHGVLVNTLARACRVTDGFRVLGDDIIIASEELATRYLETMQSLGVPISRDKTIRSRHFAEFAGKVVTRDGILASLKWREPSDRSFLDVVRLLGPRSLSLLRPRQQKVATFVSVLPQPEGFGWNPRGVPFELRLKVLELWNEYSSEPERSYYPLQRAWNKVRTRLEQPYLSMRFNPGYLDWAPTTGEGSRNHTRLPRPVGGLEHQLSISEMTGCPVRLSDNAVTARIAKELASMGFTTAVSSTDPRGINLLESLEKRIAAVRLRLNQPELNVLGL